MYMSLHQYINNNSNKYAKGTHVCIHIYIYIHICMQNICVVCTCCAPTYSSYASLKKYERIHPS